MTNNNNNVIPLPQIEVIELTEADLKAERAAKKAVGMEHVSDDEFRNFIGLQMPFEGRYS